MGYRRKKIESNRNEDEVEDRSSGMKRKQIKSYLTLGQQKYLRDAHKTPRKLKHLHLSPPHLFFTGAQLPWIHIPLVFVVVFFFF